jgi:alkylhydroperoxidase family enzyme
MSVPAGLTAEDHERIKEGAAAEGWSELDSALITSVDELVSDTMISDETWAVLARHLSTEQITDAIFTVGHYNMVAMSLNSLGVQREPGVVGFDGTPAV